MQEKIRIDYPLKVQRYTKAHTDYLIRSGAEEGVHMEFKAGDALDRTDGKKKEISKDVSSMANSDGGIIIYGLSEFNHRASQYAYVDGTVFSKEWLEQVINSKIKRRIPDLTIDVIRIGNKIQQSIYVVKIPRSYDAPHMASDGRYYKRYNFESVVMDEFEVRDAFNRTSETQLKLLPIELSPSIKSKRGDLIDTIRLQVILEVQNVSKTIENTYKTIVRIPRMVYDGSKEGQELEKYFRKYQPDYALLNIPATTPLFPKEVNTLADFYLDVRKEHLKELSQFPLKI
jgi:predicted HTH transcriptional regulator